VVGGSGRGGDEGGEQVLDLVAGQLDHPLERRSQAYKNRLVRQLERLGHKVTLELLGSA
jgi:hypothetical protein